MPGASLARTSRRRSRASLRSTKPRSTIATAASAPSTRVTRRTAIATGAIVGVVCLVTDITSRTQASHARARLAAVVDWSEDAIVTKSLDGIITTWNRGAAKLFGYSADEAVGQPVTMLIPEGRRHEEEKILARIRSGGTRRAV